MDRLELGCCTAGPSTGSASATHPRDHRWVGVADGRLGRAPYADRIGAEPSTAPSPPLRVVIPPAGTAGVAGAPRPVGDIVAAGHGTNDAASLRARSRHRRSCALCRLMVGHSGASGVLGVTPSARRSVIQPCPHRPRPSCPSSRPRHRSVPGPPRTGHISWSWCRSHQCRSRRRWSRACPPCRSSSFPGTA